MHILNTSTPLPHTQNPLTFSLSQALLEQVEGSSPAEHASEEEMEITWEPGDDM